MVNTLQHSYNECILIHIFVAFLLHHRICGISRDEKTLPIEGKASVSSEGMQRETHLLVTWREDRPCLISVTIKTLAKVDTQDKIWLCFLHLLESLSTRFRELIG